MDSLTDDKEILDIANLLRFYLTKREVLESNFDSSRNSELGPAIANKIMCDLLDCNITTISKVRKRYRSLNSDEVKQLNLASHYLGEEPLPKSCHNTEIIHHMLTSIMKDGYGILDSYEQLRTQRFNKALSIALQHISSNELDTKLLSELETEAQSDLELGVDIDLINNKVNTEERSKTYMIAFFLLPKHKLLHAYKVLKGKTLRSHAMSALMYRITCEVLNNNIFHLDLPHNEFELSENQRKLYELAASYGNDKRMKTVSGIKSSDILKLLIQDINRAYDLMDSNGKLYSSSERLVDIARQALNE